MTLVRILLFFLLALASLPAAAVRELSGQTPGGAFYRIVAPDGWRAGDPLVLYQHGFDFDPPAPNPSLGPLVEVQLAQGYAVAASSFSQRGWALFRALDDNAELLEVFTGAFGAPGEIVAFGGSMGGLVSLKLAEDPRFADRTSSVFAICPAAAGTEAWDFAFDLRLIYDQLCAGVSGGELQRGDPPHTWALNLDQIPPNLDNLENSEDALRALTRVAQCTGLGLPTGLRTLAQRQRLAELQRITRITDEAFLATNLAYAVFAMSDVVRAPEKLGGRSPFDSARSAYASGENVSALPDVRADPFGRFDLADASSLAGTGRAKILSLHTSKDQLVVPAHQAYLRRRYPAERIVSAIVAEDAPTHCAFTVAEGLAGWQALRAWSAGAPKPSVASLQSACTAILATGAAGPCRIDANATISGVVAQRRLAYAPLITYSGVWFDPARSGEGIVIEELDDPIGHWQSGAQRVLVSWFTYDTNREPLWIVGQGEVLADNAVRVRDAYVGSGRGWNHCGRGFSPDRFSRTASGLKPFPRSPGVPMRFALIVVLAAASTACTWVEPDSRGIEVAVAPPTQDLGGCVRRGEVTVSVKAEIAGIDRNTLKVQDELESLARNEAATLGATHVQALEDPHGGEQRFAAYDCG